MSPEIQEWSHKSRSKINNLYLLTRPIGADLKVGLWVDVVQLNSLDAVSHIIQSHPQTQGVCFTAHKLSYEIFLSAL